MSFVNATPEYVASAASDLAKIGSSITYANSTASTATAAVEAAGADAVSTSISQLFGAHAAAYEAISSQAALFHQQFVQLMSGGATEYADTEAVNAAPLQAGPQAVLGGAGAAGHALSTQQPLPDGRRTLGAIAFFRSGPQAFTQPERRLLDNFGRLVGISICLWLAAGYTLENFLAPLGLGSFGAKP